MIIEVEGIAKSYGEKQVLNNVSFSINAKEIVALVGPNGAGKTTLFNCISTIGNVDRGTISITNLDIHKHRIHVLKKIAFMQDSSTLYPDLTGRDHLMFLANIRGKTKQEVMNIVHDLGIDSYIDKKVNAYSTGMKQHLLLALAIISNPLLLIMDEPMNGLDPAGVAMLRDKMLQLRNTGTTILFSSHILAEVDKIADRILFIHQGELIEDRLLSKKKDSQSHYVLSVQQPNEAIELLRDFEGVLSAEKGIENDIHVTIRKNYFSQVNMLLLENDIHVEDIATESKGSENIYYELYGDKS